MAQCRPDNGARLQAKLLEELRRCEWNLNLPALRESIRLVASSCFEKLTSEHIRDVANYRTVEVGDKVFFEKAFSPGKEAAASLAIAQCIGRDVVLDDLERLEAAVSPRSAPFLDEMESATELDETTSRCHGPVGGLVEG